VRPARVAKYTRPAITVGAPEICPFARNCQSTLPVAASKQKNRFEYEPANTRSRHTAVDE